MIICSSVKDFILLKKVCFGLMASSLSMSMLLTGCSSFTADSVQEQFRSVGAMPINQASGTDIIRHIGYPTHNGIRQKGSVLVGDNYSYLISTGNDALELILQLPTANIAIEQPISIYRYPDNSVNISFSFSYAETKSKNPSLNLQQRSVLEHICSEHSSIDRLYNHCQLQLQGGMYAPLNNVGSEVKLDQGLAANIYSANSKRTKTQAEVGVIPLKVILETIELPLEILSIIK